MSASGQSAMRRELLEAALALVPFAALLIEPGTARVLYANGAADAMAGGRFPRDVERERYHEAYVCTAASGRRIPDEEMPGVRAARGERLRRYRMDWHLPEGVRALTVSSEPLDLGGEELALVVFEDVTPVRVAEQRASAAAGVLDAVVDAVPLGVGLLDQQLRYVWINATLAEINGRPAEDHVGATPHDVFGPDLGGDVQAGLEQVLGHEAPQSFDREVAGRRYAVTVFPVRSRDGADIGVGLTVQDVSDRWALLAAEQEARAAAEEAERRARFLARASDELNRSLDFDTTLQAVATFAVPERADWCAIDVFERGGLRRVAIAHSDPRKERLGWELTRRYPPAADQGTLAVALGERRAILMPEVSEAELVEVAQDDEHLQLLRDFALSGGIIVPLLVRGEVLGALTFVFEGGRRPAHLDLELAEELGRRAAAAIENARLYRERSHIAKVLQRSLLPPRLPEVPGFTVASRYRAAGEGNDVGGDFYDVFQRAPDGWVLVIGDVCGKGPEAASLTALARWTLRAAALRSGVPCEVLAELNAALVREDDSSERFMTAVCAEVGTGTDRPRVRVAAAGHPPALLLRAGGTVEAVTPGGGMLLGVLEGAACTEGDVLPGPGDALVLVTDGVTEAGAPERPLDLPALLPDLAGREADAIAGAVEDAAIERSGGRTRDDLAVLVLRRDDA